MLPHEALHGKLGEHEVAGPASNSFIADCFEACGHSGEPDETAWCAAATGWALAETGYPNTGSLAARSYATYGTRLDKPKLGCIVVMKRGNSAWQGHVGFYMGDAGQSVRVLGGNQGDAVSIATFPKSSVLGYRMPVAPTVKALRDAGSTEILTSDRIQKAAVGVGGGLAAAEAATPAQPVPEPFFPPILENVADQVGVFEKLSRGANEVLKLAHQHRWIVWLGIAIAGYLLARYLRQKRLAKHRAGIPLSTQVG